MQATKIIRGFEVRFTTRIDAHGKLIDFLVIGGGCGPASTWVEAWALAQECIGYAIDRQHREAASAASKETERLARVAKHEAKQKRRAPAQRLKAQLAAISAKN